MNTKIKNLLIEIDKIEDLLRNEEYIYSYKCRKYERDLDDVVKELFNINTVEAFKIINKIKLKKCERIDAKLHQTKKNLIHKKIGFKEFDSECDELESSMRNILKTLVA